MISSHLGYREFEESLYHRLEPEERPAPAAVVVTEVSSEQQPF